MLGSQVASSREIDSRYPAGPRVWTKHWANLVLFTASQARTGNSLAGKSKLKAEMTTLNAFQGKWLFAAAWSSISWNIPYVSPCCLLAFQHLGVAANRATRPGTSLHI